jgi:hypothetical protein
LTTENLKIQSDEAFFGENDELLVTQTAAREALAEAEFNRTSLEGQIEVLNDLKIVNTDEDILQEIDNRIADLEADIVSAQETIDGA